MNLADDSSRSCKFDGRYDEDATDTDRVLSPSNDISESEDSCIVRLTSSPSSFPNTSWVKLIIFLSLSFLCIFLPYT